MSSSRLLIAAMVVLLPLSAHAEDYVLTLKDHAFTPAELVIPANTKVKITVKNEDATTAEFESKELKRERVINGHSSAVINLGPLKPGSYPFVDEFHEDVAKGTIKAE
jgi:hypothetical protein